MQTTTYQSAVVKTFEDVISQLEEDFCKLSQWFNLNRLQLNDDRSHLLVSNKIFDVNVNVGRYTITCSESVKPLGVHIENTLKFDEQVSSSCKKAN